MNQFAKLAGAMMFLCLLTPSFAQKANHEWTSKCPDGYKCLDFTVNNTTTQVTISNSAEEILAKYNIVLRNNGTKLVWLTEACENKEADCGNVDMTGRHPKKEVPHNDLNQTVKLTKAAENSVKIEYTEFDGDSGFYFITNGKTVGMTRIPKQKKGDALPVLKPIKLTHL